jgi:hypothetical protein
MYIVASSYHYFSTVKNKDTLLGIDYTMTAEVIIDVSADAQFVVSYLTK